MKTVKDAVKDFNGVWPTDTKNTNYYIAGSFLNMFYEIDGVLKHVCRKKEFERYAKEQKQNDKPVYTHELMVRGGTNTPEQYEPVLKVFSGQKFSVFINENGKEYVRKNSKVKFRLIDNRTDEERLIDEIVGVISSHCQDDGALKDLPKTLLDHYDITPK